MRISGRQAGKDAVHALLRDMGLADVVATMPANLLVIDRHGDTVHRNAAALRAVERLQESHGPDAIAGLRAGIKRQVLQTTSFPSEQVIAFDTAGAHVEVAITFQALPPHGYIAIWLDVTEQRRQGAFLARLVEDLGTASRAIVQVSGRLADDASEVASHAGTAAAGAEQMNASIADIAANAANAVADTASAVGSAVSVESDIGRLVESSARVEAVSTMIRAIAEQTNLLALNATIESARVGAAGKGFAVVANEVKELAARTGEATSQIARLVETIQSDSADAAAHIREIVDRVNQIEGTQKTIAGAVDQQATTAEGMSTDVAAVARASRSSATAISDLQSAVTSIATQAEELRLRL